MSFQRSISKTWIRATLRRLGAAPAILLVIAWLTLFGLILAERGREGLPAQPLNAGVQALSQTAAYVVNHPATYRWHRQDLIDLACSRLTRNLTKAEWKQYLPGEPYRKTCSNLPEGQ